MAIIQVANQASAQLASQLAIWFRDFLTHEMLKSWLTTHGDGQQIFDELAEKWSGLIAPELKKMIRSGIIVDTQEIIDITTKNFREAIFESESSEKNEKTD